MKRRAVAACAVLLGLLIEPSVTRCCGPDLPEAVFVTYGEPEPPIEAFARGEIGVLHSSWRQKYLIVALRRLRGLPLDTHAALVALEAAPRDSSSAESWAVRWKQASEDAVGEPHGPMVMTDGTMQIGNDYIFYTGCLDDAFRTAIATLENRTHRPGSSYGLINDWIRAQYQVFANCRGDSQTPAPAPPGAPRWLVKDRAYQSAAALFYANRFEEARGAFEAIARDADSPWSTIAPYMVARTLTRQGTLTAGWREVNEAKLREAQQAVDAVLADPKAREYHAAARRLQGFLRFRLQRPERLAELSRAVAAARIDSSYAADVKDLTLMLDHFSPAQVESLSALHPEDEAADWVLTFQAGTFQHALARWRATHDAAWLVAALSRAQGRDTSAEELIRAAAGIQPSSAAFPTVAYYHARLLEEAGRADQARALLDRLLAGEARSWPRSAQNLLHARRLRLASDQPEFLTHAQRLPAAIGNYTGAIWAAADSEHTAMLDEDAVWLFNRQIPIETLEFLLKRRGLPDTLRCRLALSGWTRAVLLERHDLAPSFAEMASIVYPELRAGLLTYAHATNPARRDVEVTWLMLHTPGLNPWIRSGFGRTTPPGERDILRDNWWCSASDDRSQYAPARVPRDPIEAELFHPGWDRAPAEAVVEPRLRGAAERERAQLDSLGPAPDVLCRRTLAWADRAPADPRIPEALALAVRATRYGCVAKTTTAWSRRAYQRLHGRYPGSEWTRRTPYWY